VPEVTGGGPPSGRLTPGQAIGWTVALLLIALLVVLFFLYGDEVRPVLGALPGTSWLTS